MANKPTPRTTPNVRPPALQPPMHLPPATQLRIRSTMKFSWSELDPETIGGFVQLVTSVGNAVILGTTSDGGALAVTILQGDERIKDWPKDVEAFQQLVQWAEGAYGGL